MSRSDDAERLAAMPRAEYPVLPAHRLGLVRYAGAIDARHVLLFAKSLWAEPQWRADFDLVVELSQAHMSLTPAERQRLARFLESAPRATRGRLVHVCSSAASLRYSQMAEALLADQYADFRRFQHLDEALAFLAGERVPPASAELAHCEWHRVSFD